MDALYQEKELSQILQRIPDLIEIQKFFEKVKYLLHFKNEEENDSFIFEIYEPVLKIAATSSRPFTGFTQSNYDMLTRLKWRWLDKKLSSNVQAVPIEEAKNQPEYQNNPQPKNYSV